MAFGVFFSSLRRARSLSCLAVGPALDEALGGAGPPGSTGPWWAWQCVPGEPGLRAASGPGGSQDPEGLQLPALPYDANTDICTHFNKFWVGF